MLNFKGRTQGESTGADCPETERDTHVAHGAGQGAGAAQAALRVEDGVILCMLFYVLAASLGVLCLTLKADRY